MNSRTLAAVILLCLVLPLQGCGITVKPWQRGNLAKREMAISPDPPLRELREQVYLSREATDGGKGGSAGGCGCN